MLDAFWVDTAIRLTYLCNGRSYKEILKGDGPPAIVFCWNRNMECPGVVTKAGAVLLNAMAATQRDSASGGTRSVDRTNQ